MRKVPHWQVGDLTVSQVKISSCDCSELEKKMDLRSNVQDFPIEFEVMEWAEVA